MAHPLIPNPDLFGDVIVPDDGDTRNAASVEAPFQALTNRTAHLDRDKLEKSAFNAATAGVRADLSGTAVAAGSKFAVSNMAGIGLFSAVSDEITVPAAGFYRVSVTLQIHATAGSDAYGGAIYIGGVLWNAVVNKETSDTAEDRVITFTDLINIANPITDTISIRAAGGATSLNTSGSVKSRVVIEKLGPQVV